MDLAIYNSDFKGLNFFNIQDKDGTQCIVSLHLLTLVLTFYLLDKILIYKPNYIIV